MKIRKYRHSFLFDRLSQIPVKIANYEKPQSTKPPKLIYLRLGGERGKTMKA